MHRTQAAREVTPEEQSALARTLGIEGGSQEAGTIESLRRQVEGVSDPAFVSIGERIRGDLAGQLDGDLLERERDELAESIRRLPEVREAGVPDEPSEQYGELAAPGWRVYDHLVDVGFFESLEENLPRFTAEHVEHTARELILAEPLTDGLADVGFDERERMRLLVDVANNATRLARWVPTNEIPDSVEFDLEHVPPLHQRAMGGVLLWLRDLDRHLWQNEVLVTETILDDANWHAKAMLGGLFVTTTAAGDVASEGGLDDGQLTAALSASAAIQIISQEEILGDVYYITDDMRAPSDLR